jgi:hypothetical protein
MFMLQQFSIYYLLIFKFVHVKKVSMSFIFNWDDGRNQYQQPFLTSWKIGVIDGTPYGHGDDMKTSQEVLKRHLGIKGCLAVACQGVWALEIDLWSTRWGTAWNGDKVSFFAMNNTNIDLGSPSEVNKCRDEIKFYNEFVNLGACFT